MQIDEQAVNIPYVLILKPSLHWLAIAATKTAALVTVAATTNATVAPTIFTTPTTVAATTPTEASKSGFATALAAALHPLHHRCFYVILLPSSKGQWTNKKDTILAESLYLNI